MLKVLIFISFISFSLQIENCIETRNVCKTCKKGYTLVKSKYTTSIECMKNELIGSADEGCLYYSDSTKQYCQECKQGYAKDNSDHDTCVKTVDFCEEARDNVCYKCTGYYKLNNGICEKTTCPYFDFDFNGECQCREGFYKVDEDNCKKIPIKNCEKGNADTCQECNEGYILEGNQCKFVGYDYDVDDGKEEDIEINHCLYYSDPVNKKCGGCEQKYELNTVSNSCTYVCEETEDICSECKENYHLSSSGTCEIIDPNYVETDNAKGINGAIFSNLLVLILLMIFSF